MRFVEDEHQKALFDWAKIKRVTINGECKRLSDFMYAIPNGGKRNVREAARLKKQGVKSGVSDVHLPIAAGGYNCLYVEMKKPIVPGQKKPTIQESQKDWKNLMNSIGNLAVVAYGFNEAREVIEEYLSYLEEV